MSRTTAEILERTEQAIANVAHLRSRQAQHDQTMELLAHARETEQLAAESRQAFRAVTAILELARSEVR